MFKTGIVLFYIKEHSREELKRTIKILKKHRSNFNIAINNDNIEAVANNLPVGTIICQDININNNNICICLPMFSSHISMPVKTNECVWFFTHIEKKLSPTNIKENLPLLDLKNFWLSRKIGAKISEETNFCFYQRDALINKDSTNRISLISQKIDQETKNSLKKVLIEDKKDEENTVRLPNFDTSASFTEIYPGIQTANNANKKNAFKTKETNDHFYLRPVPRWYSRSHELSFQGSNNTLINLGVSYLNNSASCRDKGVIDLVSGRHFIRKYIPNNEDNTITIENKKINNFSNTLTQELPTDSFIVLENTTTRKKENIKNSDYYLNNNFQNKNFYDFEKKEGIVNFQNDASRIYISELEEKIDDGKFYDTHFLEVQKVLVDPFDNLLQAEEGTLSFDKLSYNKEVKFKNLKSEYLEKRGDKDVNLNMTPAIFMKSNNIRIVARKNFESINESLPAGSIRLVKEDNDFDYYSHISLENDGQVLLDGSTILLGNFNRELTRQDKKIENSSEMHGKGNSLLIGYEETLAEPLVLGNSLKNMISELIQINIFVLVELKKVSQDLQMHVHAGVSPGGSITGPRVATVKTDVFVNTEHSKAADQYVFLENSLNKILSRFAKTT